MARLLRLTIAILIILLPTMALADLITIQASGTTDIISQIPALNGLLGKNLSLTAVYSDTATDTNVGDPSRGEYDAGLISFSATLDGQTVASGLFPSLFVGNDLGGPTFFDEFTVGSQGAGLNVSFPGLGPYTSAIVNMRLSDSTQSVFSDDSLPTSLNLADFDLAFIAVLLFPQTNDFNTRVDATITSLTVTVVPEVPEPTTLALACLGLVGVACVRRRRL